MKLRPLGCTSLHVSELCLATHRFTRAADETAPFAVLDAYHEHGGNFIHACADGGPAIPAALTEVPAALVGRWWRDRGIARDELVLGATATIAPAPITEGNGAGKAVRFAVERALRCLLTERLDVLTVRWAGPGVPPEALRRGLDWLGREGLVRYVAFADLPAWRVAAALHEGADRGHRRIDAVEAEYSLLARCAFETELQALCREQRLGFLARATSGTAGSPRIDPTMPPRRSDWTGRAFGLSAHRRAAQAISDVARDRGCSFGQVALAWVLRHPDVTSAVIEPRSAAQVHDLAPAASIVLDRDELRQLHRATVVQRVTVPPCNDEFTTPPRPAGLAGPAVELEAR